MQQAHPAVGSPFFCSELVEAVATVRPDVEVAVLEQGGAIAGFFPFQRGRGDVGRPVLNRISEFQGVVGPADLEFDAVDLLRRCRLQAWHFGHLVASQKAFQPYHWVRSVSPYMDLSQGYEAWAQSRREAGSALPVEVARKARKLAREVGPLRFELQAADPAAFETLIAWKSHQHDRTNRFEVLHLPWLQELLRKLVRIETPGFAGLLSALYAGEKLVALHYGLASPASLHVWFPAFNREFQRYSPGLVLFVEMARAAAARGIRRIDFGKGEERYKTEFMTGADTVAEGSLDTRPVQRAVRLAWHGTKQWIRSAPGRSVLEQPLLWTRRWRQRRGMAE
jgi:CelD/BcsL family acetyltransferase involved in cellulose biosynthesis